MEITMQTIEILFQCLAGIVVTIVGGLIMWLRHEYTVNYGQHFNIRYYKDLIMIIGTIILILGVYSVYRTITLLT